MRPTVAFDSDSSEAHVAGAVPGHAAAADAAPEACDAQSHKRVLPRDTPRDTLLRLLEEARLSQHCEAVCAKGYTSAMDLAEASPEELDQLVQTLQLQPPEARRLRKGVGDLARRLAGGAAVY